MEGVNSNPYFGRISFAFSHERNTPTRLIPSVLTTSAAGWGTFSQNRDRNTQTESIELKWGKLRLKTLAFDLPDNCKAGSISVKCAGKTIKANYEMKNNRIVIDLQNDVKIQQNQSIEDRFHALLPIRINRHTLSLKKALVNLRCLQGVYRPWAHVIVHP